jgi:DNA-binding GntR family transcriptional regulator
LTLWKGRSVSDWGIVPGEPLLYLQVTDALRRQILDGTLEPGTRLPSRAQLAAQHHVSEQVIRRAIDVLTAEGLLFTQPGARPTVRQRPQVVRLTRSWYREARGGSPFRADMTAQGRHGDWTNKSRKEPAGAVVAGRLGVQAGEPVMRTEYTFRTDGEPVMLSTSWEPLQLTAGTPVVLPEQGPRAGAGVVERMRAIGQQVIHASEILTARPVTAAEGAELGTAAGTIVMVIQRTYYTSERPVETADIIVPVDRYELAYVIPVDGD